MDPVAGLSMAGYCHLFVWALGLLFSYLVQTGDVPGVDSKTDGLFFTGLPTVAFMIAPSLCVTELMLLLMYQYRLPPFLSSSLH